MRIFGILAVCLGLIAFAHSGGLQASRDMAPVAADNTDRLELIVFESPRCLYCPLIRRDVLPLYQSSDKARDIPMRFVDLDKTDLDQLYLKAPLRIMPTMVLLKNGREVSRIGGYIGPELFFHAISRMISKARN